MRPGEDALEEELEVGVFGLEADEEEAPLGEQLVGEQAEAPVGQGRLHVGGAEQEGVAPGGLAERLEDQPLVADEDAGFVGVVRRDERRRGIAGARPGALEGVAPAGGHDGAEGQGGEQRDGLVGGAVRRHGEEVLQDQGEPLAHPAADVPGGQEGLRLGEGAAAQGFALGERAEEALDNAREVPVAAQAAARAQDTAPTFQSLDDPCQLAGHGAHHTPSWSS